MRHAPLQRRHLGHRSHQTRILALNTHLLPDLNLVALKHKHVVQLVVGLRTCCTKGLRKSASEVEARGEVAGGWGDGFEGAEFEGECGVYYGEVEGYVGGEGWVEGRGVDGVGVPGFCGGGVGAALERVPRLLDVDVQQPELTRYEPGVPPIAGPETRVHDIETGVDPAPGVGELGKYQRRSLRSSRHDERVGGLALGRGQSDETQFDGAGCYAGADAGDDAFDGFAAVAAEWEGGRRVFCWSKEGGALLEAGF